MKKFFAFTLVLAATLRLSAQTIAEPVDQAAVQKIREEGLNRSQVMNTAFYLTDVAGPRLSNSPGLKRAEEWAVNTLKSWGCKM